MSDDPREAIARAIADASNSGRLNPYGHMHHTSILAVELAQAALDAIKAAGWVVVPKEPVGVAGEMPGSNGGFSMGVFKATEVPLGSQLFALQPETD